jgi:hypothetical protein
MRMTLRGLAVLAVVAGFASTGLFSADEKPKHTIKEVMKTCMKGGLCKKVGSGKGSDDDKKELLAMFTSLAASKPPKGDEDSWKEKTGALVSAAKACEKGEKDGPKLLGKAANCKACHEVHKPS